MKKKLLIVAYYFPPFAEVGSFRITKLVKYFSEFGWDITVVTVDEKYYANCKLSNDLLKDINLDKVKIIKTSRIKQFKNFNQEGIYWTKDLFIELNKLLKKENYDYMYYTGGPFPHFITAPILKKMYKIPYILDFRDPWLLSPYNLSKQGKILAQLIEPNVVKNAHLIINVTEQATKLYKDYYHKVNANKFLTFENGYDPQDFENIEDIDVNVNGIKIAYAGKFDTFRNPIEFLNALIKYNQNTKEKIYFIHIGKKEKVLENYILENPIIKKYLIQVGFVPYKKALEYIKACDVGLIISGGHPYEPTTKIYDYIALDKYILCINNEQYGYLWDSLNNYGFSSFSKNNKDDILKSFSEFKNINNKDSFNKNIYSREKIFKRLSDILTYDDNSRRK